jgi:hypothetical protein
MPSRPPVATPKNARYWIHCMRLAKSEQRLERIAQARELDGQGLPRRLIAEKLGVSEDTILRYLWPGSEKGCDHGKRTYPRAKGQSRYTGREEPTERDVATGRVDPESLLLKGA